MNSYFRLLYLIFLVSLASCSEDKKKIKSANVTKVNKNTSDNQLKYEIIFNEFEQFEGGWSGGGGFAVKCRVLNNSKKDIFVLLENEENLFEKIPFKVKDYKVDPSKWLISYIKKNLLEIAPISAKAIINEIKKIDYNNWIPVENLKNINDIGRDAVSGSCKNPKFLPLAQQFASDKRGEFFIFYDKKNMKLLKKLNTPEKYFKQLVYLILHEAIQKIFELKNKNSEKSRLATNLLLSENTYSLLKGDSRILESDVIPSNPNSRYQRVAESIGFYSPTLKSFLRDSKEKLSKEQVYLLSSYVKYIDARVDVLHSVYGKGVYPYVKSRLGAYNLNFPFGYKLLFKLLLEKDRSTLLWYMTRTYTNNFNAEAAILDKSYSKYLRLNICKASEERFVEQSLWLAYSFLGHFDDQEFRVLDFNQNYTSLSKTYYLTSSTGLRNVYGYLSLYDYCLKNIDYKKLTFKKIFKSVKNKKLTSISNSPMILNTKELNDYLPQLLEYHKITDYEKYSTDKIYPTDPFVTSKLFLRQIRKFGKFSVDLYKDGEANTKNPAELMFGLFNKDKSEDIKKLFLDEGKDTQ